MYDALDRLLKRTDPDGTVISYTYDAGGNKTSVVVPSGITTYTYDPLNRLSKVTDPDGGVTNYTYDAVGNRTGVTYPNNTKAEYTYDALNRLVLLENKRSDDSVISTYSYTLGQVGNRIKIQEDNGRIVEYTYDAIYRLVQEDITDPSLGNRIVNYTYDSVGNRLTRNDSVEGLTSYIYDENDRLLTENNTTYAYDNNGNTISRTEGTDITAYSYDFENRLIQVQTPSSLINYVYNAKGNRVQSNVNGIITNYLVDENRSYAQVLEERNDAGDLIVSYIYGSDLIEQDRGTASYYHYDGQGSTRVLTDFTQAVTDSYTYDAFGILLNRQGLTPNNYLYTGEQYDGNIGFYYLRARYMNPTTGRFITRDIYPGNIFDPRSLHQYLYAYADPVNNLDPSGHFTLVGIMVSISINLNIRAIYTRNILKAFLTSVKIANCVIGPAANLREIALLAIAQGAGSWAYDLEHGSRMLMSYGFNKIASTILEAYENMAKEIVIVKVKVVSDLKEIYEDVKSRYNEIMEFIKDPLGLKRLEAFIDNMEKYFNMLTSGNPCKMSIALEKLGNKIIAEIPDFDNFPTIKIEGEI